MKSQNPIRKSTAFRNYFLGIYAEKWVMIILWLNGYKIIRHRYKNHYGEIDIIALKKGLIIFCEVKASFKRVNIEKVLTVYQINRIKKCAQAFLGQYPALQKRRQRFDFIEVQALFWLILKIKHRTNFIS